MPDGAMKTKGERTSERILDVAEALFATNGYEGASLRAICREAGIQQPGIYNHFESKQHLYAAVLDRALSPMAAALENRLSHHDPARAQAELPGVMTDLLLEHPSMAALFQQALQGDPSSVGNQMLQTWLDRLFAQGIEALEPVAVGLDRVDLALRIIALFNLTTGYFLSQRAFESMGGGDITNPDNVARQKQLLERLARAVMPSS
ncbi:MAG: TetR/AcrR family transcriptional regulator [Candidatus Binatia bacterium]|nr:TetR/AcrR family transcriptional regulator [Candidatus Binatia bacterium]